MKKDKLYQALNYIIDAITQIEEITSCSYENFLNERLLIPSTLFYMEKLADATKYIPDSEKSTHSEINWRQIIGFRNIMVHEYLDGYDYKIVWNTIKQHLPKLKQAAIEIRKDN